MLSREISKLEQENITLKRELEELRRKMENNEVAKPRSCQYCRNYIQHYIKGGAASTKEYIPICAGHCTCGVPVSKGRKKNPRPDETCPYFELGTYGAKTMYL